MMSDTALEEMMFFICRAWPSRAERWDLEAIIPTWRDFLHCTDDEARHAMKLLCSNQERDQQWPPTAPELWVYVLKYRQWLVTNGLNRLDPIPPGPENLVEHG